MKTTELATIIGTDIHYHRRSGRFANRTGQRATVLAVNVSSGAYRRAVSFTGLLRADGITGPDGNVLTGEARDEFLKAARAERHAEFLSALGVEDPDQYVIRVEDDHDKCVALLALRHDGTPVTSAGYREEEGKQVIQLVRPNWVRETWADVEARWADAERRDAEHRARMEREAELGRRRGELALPTWEPIIASLREAGADTLADSIAADVARTGKPSWSGWMLDIDVIVRLAGHTLPEVPEVSDAEVAA